MEDNQIPVLDLNRIIDELMSEHRQGVEEVHLEPLTETVMNAEPETQPEMEEPIEEKRTGKRQRVAEQAEEEEAHFRTSPLSYSYPDLTENIPELAESSRRGEGNTEVMEILRSIIKDMEEREQRWENQQQIIEEFLKVEFRRKEQLFEQL